MRAMMRITRGQLARIIREEVVRLSEAAASEMLTYCYHPVGMDNNGNGGPASRSDPAWIKVKAADGDSAVRQLPPEVQKKIKRAMKRFDVSTADQLREDTSGWGIGFTFAVEEYNELDDIAP